MRKFLLLPVLLTSYFNVHAQTFTAGTIYPQFTDVTPDHLMYYQYFPYTHFTFDVNVFGGASNDIEFTTDGSSSPGGSSAYISIKSLSPDVYISMGRLDSVFDSTSTSWLVSKVARPLNAGDPINSGGAIWDNNQQTISDHSASFGWMKDINDWIGSEHYVGLKYQSGTNVSYGWIRLQCVKKDSCYVKDFSSVDASVGIGELAGEEIGVYPNPMKDIFYIGGGRNKIDPAAVRLTDLAGRMVSIETEAKGNELKVDVGVVPPGCYLLYYPLGDKIILKKLVKAE